MEKFIFRIARDEKELEEYFRIRREVFVLEQKVFQESDVDEYDTDPYHKAVHIVAVKESDGSLVGAVRCYRKEGDKWFGGRLSAAKGFRNGRVGAGLVRFAVETMKSGECGEFFAYVQPQNVRFFERLGWEPVGELETYQGLPHQLMKADLNS